MYILFECKKDVSAGQVFCDWPSCFGVLQRDGM